VDGPVPGGRDGWLTPGEVARLFGVDPKTVARWATAGKLTPQRTLGGHRRYRADEVRALLDTLGPGTVTGPPEDPGTAAGTPEGPESVADPG
jgi:excisionase family DNA binding protein